MNARRIDVKGRLIDENVPRRNTGLRCESMVTRRCNSTTPLVSLTREAVICGSGEFRIRLQFDWFWAAILLDFGWRF